MCSIRGAVRVARDRRATGEPLGGAVILVVFLVSSEPARKMNSFRYYFVFLAIL